MSFFSDLLELSTILVGFWMERMNLSHQGVWGQFFLVHLGISTHSILDLGPIFISILLSRCNFSISWLINPLFFLASYNQVDNSFRINFFSYQRRLHSFLGYRRFICWRRCAKFFIWALNGLHASELRQSTNLHREIRVIGLGVAVLFVWIAAIRVLHLIYYIHPWLFVKYRWSHRIWGTCVGVLLPTKLWFEWPCKWVFCFWNALVN